jgi:DNA-binding MarR family transcriptional regulator
MKHPQYQRGGLYFEIETTLRQYLATYTQQQNTKSTLHSEKSNPSYKVYSFMQDIYKWLIDSQLYLQVPQFIPKTHLENAIAALRGTDKRTITKCLKDLEKYGCIKKSSMWQYEFV